MSVHLNTKPITIKGSECRSGGSAANDIGLTPRDLVICPHDGLRKLRGNPSGHQKSAEGRKRREKSPTARARTVTRKGFKDREEGHKSHDRKAAERPAKTDPLLEEAR